jgi:glutamate dehydrogenase
MSADGQVEGPSVESRWHAQARGSLRDELYSQHRALTAQILEQGGAGKAPTSSPLGFSRGDPALQFTLGMFDDMHLGV